MEEYVSKLEKDLRKKLDRLCLMHNEPAWYVAEHFAELRRQVDLDAELLLNEIQSAIQDTEKATKDSDVNATRLEFIRILDELEKRISGIQTTPQTSSTEAYASLEQRVNAFKDTSDSLDDREDSYIHLAQEILNKTDQLEKSIFGEQTIIYWPSCYKDRLGSLVYFGDIFLSRSEIFDLMSLIFLKKDPRRLRPYEDFELLVPSNEPSELRKSEQVIVSLKRNGDNLKRFVEASKFFYIGKTEEDYAGYSAEGSSVDKEFVTYQYDEDEHELTIGGINGFDISANLFDVYSSQSCYLYITNARMNGLHKNLLPSPVDRLVLLQLIDVHFDSFDSHLLDKCTSLTKVEMQVTFSNDVKFDLEFLRPLKKLVTLELTLPHLPSDLSAFKELTELRNLKLEGSSSLYAKERPRLTKKALEQIISPPHLDILKLFCFDIEAVDREIFKECKHLSNFELARIRFEHTDDGDTISNSGPHICFTNQEKNESSPINIIEFIFSGIKALNAANFVGMTNLTDLSLTGNSIADLPRGVFNDLTSLERLDLDKNLIRHIGSGVFDNLKELKSLKLDYNPIDSIEANAFPEMHNLRELSFTGCRLKSIDNEMFTGIRSLCKLKLNNNLIERIEVVAEDGRRINVAKANLSDEEKRLVKKHLFQDLYLYDLLDLSGNKLQKLDLNCFRNIKTLQCLDLSSNMIDELSGEAEPGLLYNLKELRLNANQLSTIDKSVLPETLSNLNLSNNQLKRLDEDFFAESLFLKNVNMSQNQLTWNITETTFASCKHRLKYIDLSGNISIQATEEALLQTPNLLYINCDFNEHFACRPFFRILTIRKLTPQVLQALRKMYRSQPDSVKNRLLDICLSGCSIRALTRKPSWDSELETLNLKHINLSYYSRLEGLDFSSNLIETLDEPDLFVDFKSIHKINLSNNRLSRIHRDIFKCLGSLQIIDLSGNQLSNIDMDLFSHQRSLSQLNLSSNGISAFNLARLFRICPYLESLNLADNQLDDRSTAKIIVFKTADLMQNLVLANNRLEKMDFVQNMTLLEHLDLQGNRIESLMSNGENLLGRLSNLTHLDLSQNRIHSLRDEMFDHLYHQLSFCDLSGNPCDFQLDSVRSELI